MGCEQVRERLRGFLDLELESAVESAVRAHLASCRECREAYIAAEPSLLLSVGQAQPVAVDDATFVASVMGGIHQSRLDAFERKHAMRRYLAVAAVAVLSLTATLAYRVTVAPTTTVAVAPTAVPLSPVGRSADVEPAFVEVEGEGVRLYQVATGGTSTPNVQVAFVVDPSLEL